MHTVDDFLAWLRLRGAAPIATLFARHKAMIAPFLPKIVERLPRIEANLERMALPGMTGRRALAPEGELREDFHQEGWAGMEQAAQAARAARAPRGLSDREAWTELAGLVDSSLGEEPEALRSALKAAFLEEAANAA